MAGLGDARLRCPACDAPILLPLTQLGADLTSINLAIDLNAVRAHIADEHSQEVTVKPSIGRIVHYVAHGTPVREDGTQAFPSACRAAIVTEVDTDDTNRVGLMVANPTGQFFHPLAAGGCLYDEWDSTTALEGARPQGGSWHWPERVEDTGS